MFENIIGQNQITERLLQEFSSGALPGAMMFYGSRYGAKLTTALELSRGHTCQRDAAWNCPCPDCQRQRLLLHPNTVMMGTRYFLEEIIACGESLLENKSVPSRYLFIRSLRKLTRRFDPMLWEGEEKKLSKISTRLESLEELCDLLDPALQQLPKNLKSLVEKATEDSAKVIKVFPSDGIPVAQVRRMTWWAHTTTPGKRKVIILENADRLSEGARNALLKVLEEPPVGVSFILTTERKGAVMPTIRSRVRPYYFQDRGKEKENEILKRIFRVEDPRYDGLRAYFLAGTSVNLVQVKKGVVEFLEGVLDKDVPFSQVSPDFTDWKSSREGYKLFLEELTGAGRKLIRKDKPLDLSVLESWNQKIRHSLHDVEALNISPAAAAEHLYYGMRSYL